MEPEHYDLVVIGSGPAGEKGAAQAAFFGKRVALVEKEPAGIYGGAAANTGTLPSKTLRETALFLSGFQNRELAGLDVRWKGTINIRNFLAREPVVVGNERTRIKRNLEEVHGVRVYEGAGQFLDAHTLAVHRRDGTEARLTAEVFLIATGSTPFRPADFAGADPRLCDSDSILKIDEIPRSLLVVGGGVIGSEYACIFAILGVDVTLVEKRERLIGSIDGELADALRVEMAKLNIKFHMPDSVAEVDCAGEQVRVRLASGAEVRADLVLVSSGRNGNVGGLGLEAAGVETAERGRIKVDSLFRTSVPHILAAGDVVGSPALASTAMEQARVGIVHAFGLDFREKRAVAPTLPYGIYTIPECSMAGATEEELIAAGIPYVVGRAHYRQNARGWIIGDDDGFLKLLFREDDLRLLGVHVIGEQATELVHVGLVALLMDAGAELFLRACFNYPTLTEMYKYATYDALKHRATRRAAASAPA